MNIEADFHYKYGNYPANRLLVGGIARAAACLDKKLEFLELTNLDVSEYNKRYFGGHIATSGARLLNLTKYAYVLSWALAYLDKPKQEVVFLDHGAGHGMMSLLAKEYGIGTVIHNDIYPVSCADARLIGRELGLEADHYIPGTIDNVLVFCEGKNISCDSVANYDVIEHIYNINDFLQKIGKLSAGPMSLFFASAANERNPRINRQLMAMHKSYELKDREVKKGRKPTDATRAIAELRKEIIVKHAPELYSKEVDELTKLTRGLVKEDIKEQVEFYLQKGVMPSGSSHPTNTCDPFTGNWFENLMNPDDLTEVLHLSGFETTIRSGFYDQPKNPIKRWCKLFLNVLIRVSGVRGLFFAPYYAVSARK